MEEYLDALLDITAQAGAAVMKIYTSDSAVVKIKNDNSPLTQADMQSHHIISNGLKKLFPHIPVLSEEGDEEKNKAIVQQPSFWLVDPIDGTKEFIAKADEFTICLALIENDVPSFGIVAAPALDAVYYGGPAMGSYKKVRGETAQPIKVSQKKLGIILSSRGPFEKETAAYVKEHFNTSEVQAVGSQLKLPRIAEGLADAYPRLGSTMRLWDLAAGQAILEGAGGRVTHPDGTAIDYHSQTLMVGDFVARS